MINSFAADHVPTELFSVPLVKRPSRRRRRRLMSSTEAGTSIVELSDFYNNEYVGILGVGTPPQYLTVVFDTGSTDVWFPSSQCVTCGQHSTFNTEKSTTFRDTADYYRATSSSSRLRRGSAPSSSTVMKSSSNEVEIFHINYGSGGVFGDIMYDSVHIGNNLTLADVRMGLATEEDVTIASFDMDGICGLAFYGLASITSPTILESMSSQYPSLSSNSFSIFLSSDPDDHTKLSRIIFGGYNLSIVGDNATFFYTPVISQYSVPTYWTVSMVGFEIGDSSSGKSAYTTAEDVNPIFSVCSYGESCLAIVDSGTSGIAIPVEYYDVVLALLTEGKDCIDLDCAGVSEKDFPVLLISLEPDNVFPLLPADYVLCTQFNQCVLRLQTSSEVWILGDAFIEAYYTHFDVENMRVGFACSGECSGGTWQGTGGYVLDTVDVSVFRRAALIYSLFILLLYGLMFFINKAWKYVNKHGALYDPSDEHKKNYYHSNHDKKGEHAKAAAAGPYNPMNANPAPAHAPNSDASVENSKTNIDDILSYDPYAASALEAAQLDPYSLFTLQQQRQMLRQARLLKKSDLWKQQQQAQKRTRQILGLDDDVVTTVNVVVSGDDKYGLN